MLNDFFILASVSHVEPDLIYIWNQATLETKGVLIFLMCASIIAWSIMAAKIVQMRRARKLNSFFLEEYQRQANVLDFHKRKLEAEGCPLFNIYQQTCTEIDKQLQVNLHNNGKILHIKPVERTLEQAVANESLRLESKLVYLALAVTGSPFIGLLGTVWGVMSAFSYVGAKGSADLATMAPGVAGALIATVGGLLVAIPSMFGYNILLNFLRQFNVEMDNFAQDMSTRVEIELLDQESSVSSAPDKGEETESSPAKIKEKMEKSPIPPVLPFSEQES